MLPDLESLRCFVEAARLLNFRAAAGQVGLTPAALGQRIRKLEEQLDVELFQRTTRKVELTEAGLALLPEARRALKVAEECVRAARGDKGPAPVDVVVGTRHELGLSWLVPMLPRLREALPYVTFHLYFGSGSDLEVRVRTRDIDCAVSSRRLTDPALDFAKLHREDYVFVASPALLQRTPLDSPEDARAHALVDTSDEVPLFRYWRDAPGGADSMEFGRLIKMGTISAIEALVLSGDGVAVLPLYLVQGRLDAGDLVRVMPDVAARHDHFRLIFRADDPLQSVYRGIGDVMLQEPLR